MVELRSGQEIGRDRNMLMNGKDGHASTGYREAPTLEKVAWEESDERNECHWAG
jgi:hypothetical protein